MKILSIAPQPFFQPRGTPFSEYYRAKAMIELGHRVDLLTYPIGEDVDLPGLRIYRTWPVPGIRSVKIGPSISKLPLDTMIALFSLRRMLSERYDLLDCHEEAGFIGVLLSKLFGLPTLYDMHSSLPEQLSNFRFPGAGWLRGLFTVFEKLTVRNSDAVVVICPYLAEVVKRMDPTRPCFLIENSPLSESVEPADNSQLAELRARLGIIEGATTLVYTGTFEAYQGLDLLYGAFAIAAEDDPTLRLVMVGGHDSQVHDSRQQARALGIGERVVFTGQRPPEEMPLYLGLADVLVSPRSRGKNTPLKIYSYLRSGRPIVATRLLTHTQVLDDEVAVLTEPTPDSLAQGILTASRDGELRGRLANAARIRAENEYSYTRYLERTEKMLRFFSEKILPTTAALPSESTASEQN